MVELEQSAGLDPVLAALADPTRRAILARLGEGEQRVSDLAEPFSVSLNAISKHIKTLEEAGLVRRRRAGRTHYIAADPRPLDEIAAWIDRQRRFWNARLDRLEAALNEDSNEGGENE